MADTPDNPEEHADVFDDNFDFDADTDELLSPEEPIASGDAEPAAGMQESQSPAYHPPKGSSGSKKPLLFGIIGLAIIGTLAWQGIQYFKKPAPKPVSKMVEPKPMPMPPPKPQVEAPNPAMVNKMDLLEKHFAEQAQQNQQTQEQLKKMIADLEGSQQNLMNANKNIAALQQQIAALNGVVQSLNQQLQTAREEARKKHVAPKKHHHKKVEKEEGVSKESYANPHLTVYAIIPGRAWLRDPTGKTLTVTEGDSLPEYGKVIKIDATNGVVVTSTGVTLR